LAQPRRFGPLTPLCIGPKSNCARTVLLRSCPTSRFNHVQEHGDTPFVAHADGDFSCRRRERGDVHSRRLHGCDGKVRCLPHCVAALDIGASFPRRAEVRRHRQPAHDITGVVGRVPRFRTWNQSRIDERATPWWGSTSSNRPGKVGCRVVHPEPSKVAPAVNRWDLPTKHGAGRQRLR
jgi:hypothetical protein